MDNNYPPHLLCVFSVPSGRTDVFRLYPLPESFRFWVIVFSQNQTTPKTSVGRICLLCLLSRLVVGGGPVGVSDPVVGSGLVVGSGPIAVV